MAIVRNRAFNNPALGQAFSDLASMFAPPDAGDLANYSLARQRNQQSDIRARLAEDPQYSGFDHQAIVGGLYAPTQSFTKVNMDDATARRGQDITAATSRANSADDNRRQAITSLFGPLSQGQVRPAMPDDIAALLGVGAVPEVAGAPKPLTETEWKAGELDRLLGEGDISDNDIARDFRSGVNVEEAMVDGQPTFVTRADAIGKPPAPRAPTTNINFGPNGIDYGNPGEGLVWAREPDGKIRLDERGAPVAIPYQGGKRWEQQQAAEAAAESRGAKDETKANVVLQNIDRALAAINTNPALTTGVGSQATGWIGGSPAKAVIELLDPIRANIGFDQLQAMRDASPTGGALGQVTEREIAFLQSVLGSIDPEAGPQVLDDIKRLKNIYLDVIHGPGEGPPRERLSFPSEWDQFANPQPDEAYAVNPKTGERVVYRGGRWVPVD